MNIKQVEQLLNLKRANIRFYEKQGLIEPKRSDNNYRDYSEEEISRLKKIIIFRKLGISVEDIHLIFEKQYSVEQILSDNQKIIEKQIENLKGALKVNNQILNDRIQIDNFNEDHYLNIIKDEEKVGNKFYEIAKDYLDLALEYSSFKTGVKTQKGLIIDIFALLVIYAIIGLIVDKNYKIGLMRAIGIIGLGVLNCLIIFPFRNKIKNKNKAFICLLLAEAVLFLIMIFDFL